MNRRRRTLLALPVAATLGACATSTPVPSAPRATLAFGTGASGGTFLEYGEGLARLVRETTGIALTVVPTGGSNDNLKGIDAGTYPVALVNMGPAFEAWNGLESWTGGKPLRNMRALVPMYETPFHIVGLRKDPARTVTALDGKIIGTGPRDGPAERIFRALAEELRIRPRIESGGPGELAKRLLDGTIDAFWFGGGAPLPAFEIAEAGAEVVFFGLTDAEAQAALRRFPYMARTTMAAGTYHTQREPIATVALWNFVAVHRGLPDDIAYDITRAILSQPGRMDAVHPAARATRTANAAANGFLPFHPGAIRFYREAGAMLNAPDTP